MIVVTPVGCCEVCKKPLDDHQYFQPIHDGRREPLRKPYCMSDGDVANGVMIRRGAG